MDKKSYNETNAVNKVNYETLIKNTKDKIQKLREELEELQKKQNQNKDSEFKSAALSLSSSIVNYVSLFSDKLITDEDKKKAIETLYSFLKDKELIEFTAKTNDKSFSKNSYFSNDFLKSFLSF